jgi:hypothetical protein
MASKLGKVELRQTGFVGIKPAMLLEGSPKCPGFRSFVWTRDIPTSYLAATAYFDYPLYVMTELVLYVVCRSAL